MAPRTRYFIAVEVDHDTVNRIRGSERERRRIDNNMLYLFGLEDGVRVIDDVYVTKSVKTGTVEQTTVSGDRAVEESKYVGHALPRGVVNE